MKSSKYYYILLIIIALFISCLIIWLFIPKNILFRAAFLFLLPLLILIIGFQAISNYQIKAIRNQLYRIFQTLEEFEVDQLDEITFEQSSFPVFNELNEYLIELVNRIRSNYQANKQFTQNASHELQTPLAIIKGHVELLLNSPNLKEKEINSLGIILNNTKRLARLNHALILLSKIENNRYSDLERVNIQLVIQEVLENFEDVIKIQEIEIYKEYEQELKVEMSATLAEILFTNLIQNAIRYNLENGFIRIKIADGFAAISNPGKELKVVPASLFKRFKRESDVEESLGLGLSIVKRICDLYEFEVNYFHQGENHTLKINFY